MGSLTDAHILGGKDRTPHEAHTQQDTRTQIRQTLPLREKMDLSAEEAMLKRMTEKRK